MAVALFLSACGLYQPDPETVAADTIGPSDAALPKPAVPGVVYLLRGGLNIFSTGLDTLGGKLRAQGIDARSVSYEEWPKIATDLEQRYATEHLPIVLVGHSFGANAAAVLATKINDQGQVPVLLMILFDPTNTQTITPNVRHVVYYSSRTETGTGVEVKGSTYFNGQIETIDVNENHMSVTLSPALQDKTIAAIVAALKPAVAVR